MAAQIQRQRRTEGGEEGPGTHTKRVVRNNTERDRYVGIRDRRAGGREECEWPSPSAAAPTLAWSAAPARHLLSLPGPSEWTGQGDAKPGPALLPTALPPHCRRESSWKGKWEHTEKRVKKKTM